MPVNGAGGGVNGQWVVKFSCARFVVVTASANKLKLVESLGADVRIDRSKSKIGQKQSILRRKTRCGWCR